MKTKEDYINYKLKKADEALKEAQLLLENNFNDAAISRLYYAAFYAISALVINLNLNPKTHQGVKAFLIKNLFLQENWMKSFLIFILYLWQRDMKQTMKTFLLLANERSLII